MNKYLFVFLACIYSHTIVAQHSTRHLNMLWVNYNNTVELNNKWLITSDVQLRTRDWLRQWSLVALRTGAGYKINKQLTAIAGFTWFGNVRYVSDSAVISNEWRPWQEVTLNIHPGKGLLQQRIRTEQRFLQKLIRTQHTQAYEKRFRFRYRIEYAFAPLGKTIEVHVGNETMVNMNYMGDDRFFDQNRTFLIVNYKTAANTFIQFQYIKLIQWFGAVDLLEDQNVYRLSVHQLIKAHRH
jgi:hypothetical protein